MAQLEAWYRQDLLRMYNYVAYRVADEMAVEEILSTVCDRGVKGLRQYDPKRGTFIAWMFGIARNALNDYFRDHARRTNEVSLESLPQIQGQGDTPEEQLIRAERFREVILLLDHLTENEREVVALRYGSDLKYQEIAEVMEISTDHVGVLLHRSLVKLRDALNERETEARYEPH